MNLVLMMGLLRILIQSMVFYINYLIFHTFKIIEYIRGFICCRLFCCWWTMLIISPENRWWRLWRWSRMLKNSTPSWCWLTRRILLDLYLLLWCCWFWFILRLNLFTNKNLLRKLIFWFTWDCCRWISWSDALDRLLAEFHGVDCWFVADRGFG